TTTFEHDAAGNVIRRTDARGTVTEYRYDALNRLIERHSPSDPEKRGQIYFYYSNFSDCAHAELLKANNSLNHAPLPRHREIPLRHLNWSLHARKIRVEKINLSPLCPLWSSPLWSYEECSGGSVKITSAGAESLTVPMRPTPILMAQP
ncbi:RHS repeat protein, partial [Pseudomonas aeruginosa]|nr:RHS repeat protein [Pseudomonas aeruginosa]MBG6533155.1 RHS repeat protein [Pseudomonas aeruginosa]